MQNLKFNLGWFIIGVVMIISFIMFLFARTSEQIISDINLITTDLKFYAVITHIIFFTVIILGLIFNKFRTHIFAGFIVFIAVSTTIIAIIYLLIPNILLYLLISILLLYAYAKKEFNWDTINFKGISGIIGIIGLIFGFWYLHWVEEPIWINALFFSPLGIVNCPSLLTICGFLCLNNKEHWSIKLYLVVALSTLVLGLIGIFQLGAYIDIVMIILSIYLLIRLVKLSKET
jgi:hypothetical protein